MKIFLILFFTFQSLAIVAQENFASRDLKEIFEKLPADCKKNLLNNKGCECNLRGEVYEIRIEFDHNQITNLGVKVFNDSLSYMYDEPEFLFVEREILRFILSDAKSRDSRLKEDQVGFKYSSLFQSWEILKATSIINKVIRDLKEVTENNTDGKYQVVLTNSKGDKLSVEFPANVSIITGMDKKELESQLLESLLEKDVSKTEDFIIKPLGNLYSEGDLLHTDDENFLIKNLSNKKYFIRVEDSLKLVFSPQYIKESFSNISLGAYDHIPVQAIITIKEYGSGEKTITMPLKQFLTHFEFPYKNYFGIEDSVADNLRGSLIIFNPKLNFIHLCDIKTTNSVLFSKKPEINIIMYPFIPTHNVKDLFGTGKSNKSIQLDDLIWERNEK